MKCYAIADHYFQNWREVRWFLRHNPTEIRAKRVRRPW